MVSFDIQCVNKHFRGHKSNWNLSSFHSKDFPVVVCVFSLDPSIVPHPLQFVHSVQHSSILNEKVEVISLSNRAFYHYSNVIMSHLASYYQVSMWSSSYLVLLQDRWFVTIDFAENTIFIEEKQLNERSSLLDNFVYQDRTDAVQQPLTILLCNIVENL